MKVFRQKARFIPGSLLVCGTCVGAGMLGLPVVTGPSGLAPTLFINTICFIVMLLTGLYFMEATLWMPDQANLISMTERFFGRLGKWVSAFFFLFLYYCLMVVYVSGGQPLFDFLLETLSLSKAGNIPLFSLIFGTIILIGARFVGKINSLLMVGFGISYFMLIGASMPQISKERLLFHNWPVTLFAAPTLLTAYGYHNVIPSLSTYLKRDRKQLILSILIGTTLSFLIFTLWQTVIIGAIPQDVIQEAKLQGIPITQALQYLTGHPWIRSLSTLFAFFALTTSLLGVSLSMVDFLGDGLKWERTGTKRLLLCLLIFVPPTLFAYLYPGIFMSALGIAGGVGEAILNGLIPLALAYVGVHKFGLKGLPTYLTSRPILILLLLITAAIMAIEIRNLIV